MMAAIAWFVSYCSPLSLPTRLPLTRERRQMFIALVRQELHL
jgi:hypothetical protein